MQVNKRIANKVFGFTLLEVMVALVCASILTAVAWDAFSLFSRCYRQLSAGYRKDSAVLFLQLRQIKKNARGLGERSINRF